MQRNETRPASSQIPPHILLMGSPLFSLYICKSTNDLLTTIRDHRLSTPATLTDGPKCQINYSSSQQLQDLQDPQATQVPLNPYKRVSFASPLPKEEYITD